MLEEIMSQEMEAVLVNSICVKCSTLNCVIELDFK